MLVFPSPPWTFSEAEKQFYLAYGATLSQWGRIEQALFGWFHHLTGMKEEMARGVFYSARNFNARSEMLEAALDASNADQHVHAFLQASAKRAAVYSSFRNTVTHGEMRLDTTPGSAMFQQYVLMQGHLPEPEASKQAITIPKLYVATKNFKALADYVFEALRYVANLPKPTSDETSPQKRQQQVRELPTAADSPIGVLIPQVPLRPRRGPPR